MNPNTTVEDIAESSMRMIERALEVELITEMLNQQREKENDEKTT